MENWRVLGGLLLLLYLVESTPMASDSNSSFPGEVSVGKEDGIQWKAVAFKMMKLNASERANSSESEMELVPHVWSKQLAVDHFLPICDPSPLAAHLMCKTAKHDTYTEMIEIDGSSSTADHFVQMICKSGATTIEDCSIYPVDKCTRVAEITCGKCGGEMFISANEHLTVTSPGFPFSLLPMVDCQWHFISPSSESPVVIEFEEFDMPSDCRVAGLSLGSLLRTGMQLMVGQAHCGSTPPEDFESDSTVAVLRFSSWHGANPSVENTGHRGFKARICVKAMKDEMHLSVALGFTAAILLVLIILACAYHKRIVKMKRLNEYQSKRYTEEYVCREGQDSPDHIYTKLAEPVVTVERPESRRPLQTIFERESLRKAPLLPPPRSSSERQVLPAHVKKEVSFLIPTATAGDYVVPNRSLSKKSDTEKITLPLVRTMLKKNLTDPVSEGYITRPISIRRRDRASSFPFLFGNGSNSASLKKKEAEPHYVSVQDSDSFKTAGSKSVGLSVNRVGGHHGTFYTPSPESSSSIPVINLEDCNEDGCKFVKTIV